MDQASAIHKARTSFAENTTPEVLTEYIRKRGSKWVILSKKGKVLGTYDSHKAAAKRLGQIEYFKHRGESLEIFDQAVATVRAGVPSSTLSESLQIVASCMADEPEDGDPLTEETGREVLRLAASLVGQGIHEEMKKNFKVGKASGRLIDFEFNDFYYALAKKVEDKTGISIYDIVFLVDLTNGGEKGAGLKVLQQIMEWARTNSLVVVAKVEELDWQKAENLISWYISTGLFRFLGNSILIDVNVKPKTEGTMARVKTIKVVSPSSSLRDDGYIEIDGVKYTASYLPSSGWDDLERVAYEIKKGGYNTRKIDYFFKQMSGHGFKKQE